MVALQWGRDRSVAEITARVGRLRTYWIGFNGAATDRSRKLPPSARAGSGSQSFNGAATDRSRKCNGHRAVPHRSRPASMGPRPIGRGNTQSLRTRGGGRGMLQWGRDRSVAEMPGKARPTARGEHASMGPRPIGRGNTRKTSDEYHRYDRFNGAATDRSRKYA